ncbi:MAG: hypothetical protein KA956_01660 [Pyrinomonadaceae bacterium]|nr:hypothetical protein [Acidobacteriota bacterium]MBP7375161.1 hypothetical protein [Pyrinomonadaceae bacterium]
MPLKDPMQFTQILSLFCRSDHRKFASLSQSWHSRSIKPLEPVGLVGGWRFEAWVLVYLMGQTEIYESTIIIVIGTGDLIILVVMVGKRRNALMAPILAAERPATVLFVRK